MQHKDYPHQFFFFTYSLVPRPKGLKTYKKVTCEMGCYGECGFNWYKRNYNNNNPFPDYWKVCECCGGDWNKQLNCKHVCKDK